MFYQTLKGVYTYYLFQKLSCSAMHADCRGGNKGILEFQSNFLCLHRAKGSNIMSCENS